MTGLTVAEVRGKRGIFKYVRLNDGSFRFTEIRLDVRTLDHKDIVPEGMTAISAGSVGIYGNEAHHNTDGSITLDIYESLPDDEAEIRKALA